MIFPIQFQMIADSLLDEKLPCMGVQYKGTYSETCQSDMWAGFTRITIEWSKGAIMEFP